MKAFFRNDGTLVIQAKNAVETVALRAWSEKTDSNKLPDNFVIDLDGNDDPVKVKKRRPKSLEM